MSWSSALPPHHAAWLGLILDTDVSGEARTTCADCVMCERPVGSLEAAARLDAGNPDAGGLALHLPGTAGPFFGSQTKCCTYLPELPNFLVGGALKQTDDPGRRSVVARVEAGRAVTPLGLAKTLEFKARYGAHTFGVEASLRCPHYLASDGGKCGVWSQRNAICATWFCHFDRGNVSKRFWATTSRFFKLLEAGLARWCVTQLDPGGPAIDRLVRASDEDRDQVASEATRATSAELWGRWLGRELEFFVACADLVAPLSPAQVLALAGPQAQLATGLVRDAHAELAAGSTPDPLRAAEVKVLARGLEVVRVETYSPLDPVEIPAQLLEALAEFDGQRANAEARSVIQGKFGLELSDALVGDLVDFGLLEAVHTPQDAVAAALAAIRAQLRG